MRRAGLPPAGVPRLGAVGSEEEEMSTVGEARDAVELRDQDARELLRP